MKAVVQVSGWMAATQNNTNVHPLPQRPSLLWSCGGGEQEFLLSHGWIKDPMLYRTDGNKSRAASRGGEMRNSLGPQILYWYQQTTVTARNGAESSPTQSSPTQSLAAVMKGGDGETVMLRKFYTQGSGSQDLPKIRAESWELRNPPTMHPTLIPHCQLYWPHHKPNI